MQVRLGFEGNGWITLSLAHGGQSATLVGWGLHDTPRELLEKLVRLLSDGREERVAFVEDPGEWLLRLRVLPGRLLRIEVHGPSKEGPPREPFGEPVFRHTEPLERFATRILGEFDRELLKGGEDGYAYRWGLDPFPRRAYDALTHILREYGTGRS